MSETTTHRSGGALFALAGACLWGTTGTSQALLVGQHSPIAVGALRAIVAAVALVAVALAGGPRRWLDVLAGGRWRMLVGAAVAEAAYQLSFFSAVARTGVAVGTLVMLATAPAVAGIVGWVLHGLRPSRTWFVATVVALAGAALLVLGSGGSQALDWGGLLLAVLAGASFAAYTILGRVVAEAGVSALPATGWIFLFTSVLLLGPLLSQDLGFVTQSRNPLVLVWLGLTATALAYVLFQHGMKHIAAATAATLALAEPMVANLLAVFVLHEPFTLVMGLGLVLVLGGLALLARA